MATGGEASRGSKPFAAAPRPEPMHGASSHPNPRNVASLRSRNQARFSCLISDSSLLLTDERRFAPTTVRYRRISVRYESEQVSAFIGIRSLNPMTIVRSSLAKKLPSQGGDRTVFKPAGFIGFQTVTNTRASWNQLLPSRNRRFYQFLQTRMLKRGVEIPLPVCLVSPSQRTL